MRIMKDHGLTKKGTSLKSTDTLCTGIEFAFLGVGSSAPICKSIPHDATLFCEGNFQSSPTSELDEGAGSPGVGVITQNIL